MNEAVLCLHYVKGDHQKVKRKLCDSSDHRSISYSETVFCSSYPYGGFSMLLDKQAAMVTLTPTTNALWDNISKEYN